MTGRNPAVARVGVCFSPPVVLDSRNTHAISRRPSKARAGTIHRSCPAREFLETCSGRASRPSRDSAHVVAISPRLVGIGRRTHKLPTYNAGRRGEPALSDRKRNGQRGRNGHRASHDGTDHAASRALDGRATRGHARQAEPHPTTRRTRVRQRIATSVDLSEHFSAEGVSGAFVGFDAAQDEAVVHAPELAEARYLPASTFKIPHAAIALETGALQSADEIIPWDGQRRWHPSWNLDLTLREAIRHSSWPHFATIAKRIGPERMTIWLESTGKRAVPTPVVQGPS